MGRRRQHIDATFRSLCLHGDAGTSVRSIAALAGLSQGMVRHHFKTKADLLAATTRHLSDRFHDAAEAAVADAGPDPSAKLRAILLIGLRPPILDRDYVRARYILWSLSHSDAAMREAHEETYGRFRRRLEGLLAEIAASHGAAIDVAATARLLMALLKGAWVEWLVSPEAVDPERIVARFLPMLEDRIAPQPRQVER
ncbi:MAG: TetR/AcrR family transcriptional regulator [Alphaproteobacteria bacterium]